VISIGEFGVYTDDIIAAITVDTTVDITWVTTADII
jgi:hypothetical protein